MKWLSSREIKMKWPLLHTKPTRLESWTLDSFSVCREPGCLPHRSSKEETENQSTGSSPCPQISLTFTLYKMWRESSMVAIWAATKIGWEHILADQESKQGPGGHRPGVPQWVSHISALATPKHKKWSVVGLSRSKKMRKWACSLPCRQKTKYWSSLSGQL